MTGPPGTAGPRRLPDLTTFVHTWATAIAGTPHVPMTRPELHDLLRGLAGRLGTALLADHADPFDAMVGYWVATDLVAAGFDAPEALGRSVAVIEAHLSDSLGRTDAQTRTRVTDLLQTITTGFARALRDRTLDAQEEIRTAAMTARMAAERKLRHQALHDTVTGLPNRVMLIERLRRLSAGSAPDARFGVCHLGLDGLDAVKTSLGPDLGDRLLRMVADRLREYCAESGHFAARWGDDQFVILAEHTMCADDAVKVADRVLAHLGDPYRLKGLDLPVRATAGVVERPAAGADATEVMRAADLARHWARADRDNRWMVFDPRRNAREVERYRLSAALPDALRRGEFTLDYQPLVNLRDGTVAGVEALARWHHPTLGRLGPERFVGLAEDTGLIVRLGIQLLEQACRQAVGWADRSAPTPYVSVNLAVGQLRQPGLAGEIATILDRTGLPPQRLQLEITESALIDTNQENDAIGTLRAIADLGVRIAVDDFGTGYSNLSYLPTLPVHGLKLDRSFLANAATPAGSVFLAHLVALGHALGLAVTGEGVETGEHIRHLAAAGCDVGQGWYLGLPVPADQIHDLVTRPDPKR